MSKLFLNREKNLMLIQNFLKSKFATCSSLAMVARDVNIKPPSVPWLLIGGKTIGKTKLSCIQFSSLTLEQFMHDINFWKEEKIQL